MRQRPLVALALLAALLSTACSGRQKRPNAIPDEPESQEVLQVIDRYRSAMEARDLDALTRLASPAYAETMGTADGNDDIGAAQLAEKLRADFEHVMAMRLDIEVLKIEFDEEKRTAMVDYRYDVRFQLDLPSGAKWHNSVDVNRMVMRLEEPGWRIVSGM